VDTMSNRRRLNGKRRGGTMPRNPFKG